MRFLLNMNVPRELGRRLTALGHESRHVGDIGMAQTSDAAILEEAGRNSEVIVTHDLDYGRLLSFSGRPLPSVIIFRLRNVHPNNLVSRLVGGLTGLEKLLLGGAIVILEDAALRVRRLPVTDEEQTNSSERDRLAPQ